MWRSVGRKEAWRFEFIEGMASRSWRFDMPARKTLNCTSVRRWSHERGNVTPDMVYAAGMFNGSKGFLGDEDVLGWGRTAWTASTQ
jgi:hypothetical protein